VLDAVLGRQKINKMNIRNIFDRIEEAEWNCKEYVY
jgi:hypothetical protein